MGFNASGKVNDFVAFVDAIDPQAITAGATGVLTGAIDMKNYSKLVAQVLSGTLGASGTLDGAWLGCATSGGTYVAISGAAMTQMVKATNDNDLAWVELDRAAVEKAGYRYVKFRLVAGTANATSAAVINGIPAHTRPASDFNHADVVETVAKLI